MLKFGRQLFKLEEVDSTNNFATNLINGNLADNGSVVVADFQTLGKGQRGNSWESQRGMNLTASIIFFPDNMALEDAIMVNWNTSLCIVQLLQQKGLEATIKWPNDIFIGNAKIAGILIETITQGHHVKSMVIGIGLNINQEEFEVSSATSLKKELGQNFNVKEILLQLSDLMTQQFEIHHSKSYIKSAYEKSLYRRSIPTWFHINGVDCEGVVLGVSEEGKLNIAINDKVLSLEHRQFQWVIPKLS